MLAWEQRQFDLAVGDAFGYHALQLGLPELDALRANRMRHRWVASDTLQEPDPLRADLPVPDLPPGVVAPADGHAALALRCDFEALPFPDQSIDLVLVPHALELARDPHHTLRDVERVLRPEGRVVITGFNPASLWGLRQRGGQLRRRAGFGADVPTYLPGDAELIGYRRLRDWLRLLGFEVEAGHFGCWTAPLHSETWLQRTAALDRLGDRWWPVLGAAYMLQACKRVRGMRLVGRMRSESRAVRMAPAAVARLQLPTAQAQPAPASPALEASLWTPQHETSEQDNG